MFRYCIRAYPSFNLSSNHHLLYRTPLRSFPYNVVKNYSTNLSNINDKYKVYTGPLFSTAKKLKIFSIASLITAAAISPIIMIVDVPVGLEIRTILVVFTMATSALSTGFIHLCLSPYVKNIYYNPYNTSISSNEKNIEQINQSNQSTKSETSSPKITPDSFLTFETLTLFGRSNFTTLPVKSLEPSYRFFT